MELPKPDGVSRLVSMNINGLRRGNDYQDAREMAQALKISGTDLWNLQETNVNW